VFGLNICWIFKSGMASTFVEHDRGFYYSVHDFIFLLNLFFYTVYGFDFTSFDGMCNC